MSVLKRLSALVLSLCLLMAAFSQALAEESTGDEVTRSDFSFSLLLHADGFPNDGAAHYADWETFLSKLSLEGVVDVQRFLTNISRVYFDGGLCVNGKMALPFVYDGSTATAMCGLTRCAATASTFRCTTSLSSCSRGIISWVCPRS